MAFTIDEQFKHTGVLGDESTTVKRTGVVIQLYATAANAARFGHAQMISINAELFADGHWRCHLIADYCPSQHFTGTGDPIDLFVERRAQFVAYMALTKDERKNLPWEEMRG